MASGDGQDFLRDLFIESNKEVKEGYIRLEAKIEHLQECFEKKVQDIESVQTVHSAKLAKHEHTFTLTGIFLSALGVLSGLFVSVWNNLPWINHK